MTAAFTTRKINHYKWAQYGRVPSGASTVSVTIINNVRECLQVCQQNIILSNCRAANYHWPSSSCDLMDDFATDLRWVVQDVTYLELVTGESPFKQCWK